MFPLAGDKMKKEKNKWKIAFNILIVLNVLVFCYALVINLLPSNNIPYSRTRCSTAVNCTQCNKGKRTCQYYNDDMVISNDTIECDCVVENEK